MNSTNNTFFEHDAITCPISDKITVFILPIISIFGVLTNLISTVTFHRIIFNHDHKQAIAPMYYYLYTKSLTDCLMFALTAFSPIYFCQNCDISKSWLAQFWNIYIFNYFTDVLLSISAIFEIAASFDIKFNLNQKFVKTRFIRFSIIACLGSILFSLVNIFRFQIVYVSNENNKNITYYKTIFSDYHSLTVDKYVRFIQSIIKDYIILITMCVFNVLIVISVRESMNKKEEIFTNLKRVSKIRRVLSKTEKTKANAKIMVMVIGIVFVVGHMPLAVHSLPFINTDTEFWSCYYIITFIPFYLAYTVSFVIYIKFNKLFKIYFFNFFNSRCLRKL